MASGDLIRRLFDPLGEIDKEQYEAAVLSASEDELGQVATLDKKRLKEWVESPKRMRPYLLKRWKQGAQASQEPGHLQTLIEACGAQLTGASGEKLIEEATRAVIRHRNRLGVTTQSLPGSDTPKKPGWFSLARAARKYK